MLPALQPSRPKPPQQSALPTCAHQQRRAAHESSPHAQQLAPLLPGSPARPRSQIDAMPPFRPAQTPAPLVYDSAIRHPVFFTQNLKKPPFPMPRIASQGWSPVANGYIEEQQRDMGAEPKTKL
ncbi:hypothetical protein BDU57DRAFT_512962 [Ampelomyces quisqualis]|uniref:Uncharacterized protein n=1 Tax=Ampelomyces quisqualis TaxID=50730 RepID=A0A6A5QVG7_AMPQU|nr:hypothetical protein BDU57DRAFT_512962 [Ampelomyces quisqualis]